MALYSDYMKVKKEHMDAAVLFKVGSFYQIYYYDAIIISDAIKIKLSTRSLGGGNYTLCCGIPTNGVERHLSTILAKGIKVVICDVVVDDNTNEKVRKVTQIINPTEIKEKFELWNSFYNSYGNATELLLRKDHGLEPKISKKKSKKRNIETINIQANQSNLEKTSHSQEEIVKKMTDVNENIVDQSNKPIVNEEKKSNSIQGDLHKERKNTVVNESGELNNTREDLSQQVSDTNEILIKKLNNIQEITNTQEDIKLLMELKKELITIDIGSTTPLEGLNL